MKENIKYIFPQSNMVPSKITTYNLLTYGTHSCSTTLSKNGDKITFRAIIHTGSIQKVEILNGSHLPEFAFGVIPITFPHKETPSAIIIIPESSIIEFQAYLDNPTGYRIFVKTFDTAEYNSIIQIFESKLTDANISCPDSFKKTLLSLRDSQIGKIINNNNSNYGIEIEASPN